MSSEKPLQQGMLSIHRLQGIVLIFQTLCLCRCIDFVLQRKGFDERVVKLVICHSPSYHMHIADPMAMCLHYADLFSCDHIHMVVGREPFFVR